MPSMICMAAAPHRFHTFSHVLQTLPEQRQEAELTHFPDA